MESKNYFSAVTIGDKKMTFNQEAIETMNLDAPGAKLIILEVTNPEKEKNNKEILVVKTNGSTFDDQESLKEILSDPENSIVDKNLVKEVVLKKEGDDIIEASVNAPEESIAVIKKVLGEEESEYKLIPCNSDSDLGKEFKETFDIKEPFYKFVALNDKRNAIGKEKVTKQTSEERIKIK